MGTRIKRQITLTALVAILAWNRPALAQKRVVEIKTSDGISLKATYHSPGKPGPGVMLFHMCNRDRSSWDQLTERLLARGIHVLAYDYRGFGESAGEQIPQMPLAQVVEVWRKSWGPDMRAVHDWFVAQPGVDQSRLVSAGGSCGVFMSLLYAEMYTPHVKGAVIMAGPSEARLREFVAASSWLAVLGVASREETGPAGMIREVVEASKNPQSRMLLLDAAGHGTDLLTTDKTLTTTVTDWIVERLSTVSAPVAVNKPSLTYIPEKRFSLLFGGFPPRGRPLAESWALENGCWRKLQIPGPPARGAHGAAYDSHRKRLVVFGGVDWDWKPLGDTWEFDGENWEKKSVSGPAARMTHRMVFDTNRKRVVLFGGSSGPPSGTIFSDTWEWDGATWTKVSESGPPARFEHVLAYDTNNRSILLFGGNDATDGKFSAHALGDTWLRKANRWTAIETTGPPKRDHHAMAFDTGKGVALLFGGHASGRMLNDTWTWDGRKWTEVASPDRPSPRGGVPAITFDSHRRKVVLYGGWGEEGPLRDLWEWDGTWTRIHDAIPSCIAKSTPARQP